MASLLRPPANVRVGSCDSTDNDELETAADADSEASTHTASLKAHNPALFHKVKNERSILALLISKGKLYAGTQGGDLLVC